MTLTTAAVAATAGTLPGPAVGTPLELWAALPAGHLGRWAGPSWRHGDVDRRLVAGGLRPVADTADGILVEPLLSWRLPADHPDYAQPSPLAAAYAATCRAAARLAARRHVGPAVTDLCRAGLLLDRLLGAAPTGESADLRAACAALARRVRSHGATPEVLAAATGWFGRDGTALLPRTVRRLAAVRALLPAAVRAGTGGWTEVEAILASPAVLGVFTARALATALDGSGELLATLRLARRGRWPGLALIDDRFARHPLRADAGSAVRALRRLDPVALAGRTRPGRLADPVRPAGPTFDAATVDAVLLWTEVGRRLLACGPLPATATMADLVVVDAVREIVGVGLEVLDGAPVRAALGDPAGASEFAVRRSGRSPDAGQPFRGEQGPQP